MGLIPPARWRPLVGPSKKICSVMRLGDISFKEYPENITKLPSYHIKMGIITSFGINYIILSKENR